METCLAKAEPLKNVQRNTQGEGAEKNQFLQNCNSSSQTKKM